MEVPKPTVGNLQSFCRFHAPKPPPFLGGAGKTTGTLRHRTDRAGVTRSCAREDWNSRNKDKRAHAVTQSLSSYKCHILFWC